MTVYLGVWLVENSNLKFDPYSFLLFPLRSADFGMYQKLAICNIATFYKSTLIITLWALIFR